MKNAFLLLAILATTAMAGPLQAQTGALKRGDKQYENMVYPAAVKLYTKGLRKQEDLRCMERIADSYEQLGDLKLAEEWWAKVVQLKGTAPSSLMRYGMVLKANGNYEEARKWLEAYAQTGENPAAAARLKESCDFAVQALQDSSRYKITPEKCNTPGSEFGPVKYKQGYVIVGEARTGGRRMVNLRNGNNFYDLFYVEPDRNSKTGVNVTRLRGKANGKFHDGPAAFTRDQGTLYFTRSEYVQDQRGRSPMQRSKLKVYSATYLNGKWADVTAMAFNSENYSCGHPAVSTDGKTLVFSSDIPGGFGGTDLYLCRKQGSTWSMPENLGSAVNTDGDEQFPYIHNNGWLFFASTGHPGLGGFDIFAAGPEGDRWGKASNCGNGLNSSKDDFSVMWANNKAQGYFASDRGGNDDIYAFTRKMKVEGQIVDRNTGRPLAGVPVTVMDGSSREAQAVTDADGKFEFLTDWGREYKVTAEKAQYLPLEQILTTTEVGPHQDMQKQFSMAPDLTLTVLGSITDASTKKPLAGVSVRLISDKELTANTDAQGNYAVRVTENKRYHIVVRKPGYVPQIIECSTDGKMKSEEMKFDVALKPGMAVLVEGRTVVNETQEPLGGVHVRAVSMHTQQEFASNVSRPDGRFWQVLNADDEPTLIGSKSEYFSSRAELPGIDGSVAKDTVVSVTIGMVPYKVGALVKIIYYDYDKSDIKKLATKDLWEIIYFMQDNPAASVELSSHTDSRGGAKYNAELSQRRSDAAVSYIISKNIDRTRLSSKGYGEAQLVNDCRDDMPCTDEQHAQNRRTEIRITKLN